MTQAYILTIYADDPRYAEFSCDHSAVDEITERALVLDDAKIGANWIPPPVAGRVKPFNDNPGLQGLPAFSSRAVTALRDLLEPSGELLPFTSSVGDYFVFRTLHTIDALDKTKAQIRYFQSSPDKVLQIKRYEFLEPRLRGASIFRIPERPLTTFVTDVFTQRVEDCGLHGFCFKLVWPLPPHIDYSRLHADAIRKHVSEGLRDGQTLKGQSLSLAVRFGVTDDSMLSTARANELLQSLDSFLISPDPSVPPTGHAENMQLTDDGLHLMFSCPDADVLWVRILQWSESLGLHLLSASKRHGHFADDGAPSMSLLSQ